MEIPKNVFFDGLKFRLTGKKRYYVRTFREGGKQVGKLLHRYVWEISNGRAVPVGFDIHHKNFDCFNNEIGNLELLSRKEHQLLHSRLLKGVSKPMPKECLAAPRDWHRSEEGIAFHRKQGKETWNREQYDNKCCSCLSSFKAWHKNTRFCSHKCQQRFNRKRIFSLKTKCRKCENIFLANRYVPAVNCETCRKRRVFSFL